jgi:hypothetical protein
VLVSYVLSVERISPSCDVSSREYAQTSRLALLVAENAVRYLKSGGYQPFYVGQRAQAGNDNVGINPQIPGDEHSLPGTRTLDSFNRNPTQQFDASLDMKACEQSGNLTTEDPFEWEPRRFDDDNLKPEADSRRCHLSPDKASTNDDKTLARKQKGSQSRRIVQIAQQMHRACTTIGRKRPGARARCDDDSIRR